MSLKLKEFFFTLDRPPVYRHVVYKPGEIVNGHCHIHLEGELNLSHLCLKLGGRAWCQWSEGKYSVTGKQILLDLQYKPGNVYPTVLTTGEHKIGFNFQLPPINLPGSFEGQIGYVRYKLKAKIHTPGVMLAKKHKLPIYIDSPALHSTQELMQELTTINRKSPGFFSNKDVTLSCHLQNLGHNLGNSIPIECAIDNRSERALDVRASLKYEVTYHEHKSRKGRKRKTKEKISMVQGTKIQEKSEQKQLLHLPVPSLIPVTMTSSDIIRIRYLIVVTLVISGSIDLHCKLPVILTNQLYEAPPPYTFPMFV